MSGLFLFSMNLESYKNSIKSTLSFKEKEELALWAFYYQAEHIDCYKQFLHYLKINPKQIKKIKDIPLLPIQFFKHHIIIDGEANNATQIFESSGTTGSTKSYHYVRDITLYENQFLIDFEKEYGPIGDYALLALLPSYMERPGSSLLYMAAELIRRTDNAASGFYASADENFLFHLHQAMQSSPKVMVLGVSFALLDWAEKHPIPLGKTILMETGGMKGRRTEWVRDALHEKLKKSFGVPRIHSEYGMTELLSQSYARENGFFNPGNNLIIRIMDPLQPLENMNIGRKGVLGIIDLANIHSCCFIQTQDLGTLHKNGLFTVDGRLDYSDLRGCNLLVS
jgi:phenylacetate-coenzyme A ligase PaaK-like adenylate-forming protein